MNTPTRLTAITLLYLGSLMTAPAQQIGDDLKQRILAQAQSLSPDDYAFTRTTHSEARWNTKTSKNVRVEQFDPTKPAAARWTLVSIDGAPPSAAQLRKYRKEARKRRVIPGYHRVANYFGAPATVSSEQGGKTMFHFDTLPKGSVSILEKDLSQIASAEASVTAADGAPFVEQVRVTLVPLRTPLLFKFDEYETTFHYRVGPGGKPFLTAATSDMSGSGFGLKGSTHISTTYTGYQAVGRQQ